MEKNNVSLSKAIQLKLRAIRNLVRHGTLVLFFDHGKCHLAFISLCWDVKPLIAVYLLCLTRLRPSWGSQWCQQSTSMGFQFREEGGGGGGGGDFLGSLTSRHIHGKEFYVHQVLVYHLSGGTERIQKSGPPEDAEDNGPGILSVRL